MLQFLKFQQENRKCGNESSDRRKEAFQGKTLDVNDNIEFVGLAYIENARDYLSHPIWLQK